MEENREILNELKDLAPSLANLQKVSFYKAPEGYFSQFNAEILKKVYQAELEETAPALSKLQKAVTAEAPAAYFNSFSSDLISKIRAAEVKNELAEIASALSKLEKVNALAAPASYFNSLPEQLLSKALVKTKSRSAGSTGFIESLNNVVERLGAVVFKPKYTVAFAGFATVLIVAGMLFFKFEQCNDLDCKFAQLSSDEIDSYLSQHPDNSKLMIDAVDENSFPEIETKNIHPYTDALKDVDDATLKEAAQD